MNLSKILTNIIDAVDVIKNGIKKPNDEPITLSIKTFIIWYEIYCNFRYFSAFIVSSIFGLWFIYFHVF